MDNQGIPINKKLNGTDKQLREVFKLIHFTEEISAKIHGINDPTKIFTALIEEFSKTKKYVASIMLLDDQKSELSITYTSVEPHKIKLGESLSRMRLKDYKININKSKFFKQILKGKTTESKVSDLIKELLPRPLALLISKLLGYEKKKTVLTPLKKNDSIIGVFSMTTTDPTEYIIPSVKNLSQHISYALELAEENIRRIKVQKELLASQKRLEHLLISTPAVIYTCKPKGNFPTTFISENVRKQLGYRAKDFISNPKFWSSRIHPDDVLTVFKELSDLSLKNQLALEYRFKHKNGTYRWMLDEMKLILDNKNRAKKVIGYWIDITERKKAEVELLKAKKSAERSKAEKEQFFATMSHEIRTPISVVVSATDLLLSTKLSKEQSGYANAIKLSADNLLNTIDNTLDLSKIEAGKIEFKEKEFKIKKIFNELTNTFTFKASEKNLKLSQSVDKNIPDRIIGDPMRLKQILSNLVSNAIKYTNKGYIKISARRLSQSAKRLNIAFSVKDTGIGIPRDQIHTIFKSYTQVKGKGASKLPGVGLGLSIIKKLIEAQNGSISIKSRPNKGSIFTFTLKFEKTKKVKIVKKKEKGKTKVIKSLRNLNILLVEDNKLNQLVVKNLLKNYKVKVELAENGEIALNKLRKNNYDIVLMDLLMPKMDGFKTTKYIRTKFTKTKRKVPIIALTAYSTVNEHQKVLKAGMNDYVVKPFKTDILYTKIINQVNNTRKYAREKKK